MKNGSWVSSGASVVQAGWSDLLWTYLTHGLVSFFPALKCDLSLSLKLVSKPDRTFRTFFTLRQTKILLLGKSCHLEDTIRDQSPI